MLIHFNIKNLPLLEVQGPGNGNGNLARTRQHLCLPRLLACLNGSRKAGTKSEFNPKKLDPQHWND